MRRAATATSTPLRRRADSPRGAAQLHAGSARGHPTSASRCARAAHDGRPRASSTRAVVHVAGRARATPSTCANRRAGRRLPQRARRADAARGRPSGRSRHAARAGAFSEAQIELLQTFADQAVIAIENVRLFKELQARTGELTRSVDQLTALGEISQAVSSTLDVETVLQTIVSRASQLAGADGCAIYEYDDATEAFHIRATHNLDPVLVETLRAAPLRKGEGAMGRAAETREPTQVADIAAPGAYQSHIRDTLLGAGYRALLSVPLLREGEIIGSLSLNRHTPGEFPPEAVEVLKTFATQSALAIQNARLFREIADKSRQLEAASRHKSEFLANMSHELRTPLNAIIGFSEVLAERMFGDVNDKQAEYLQDILESGRHLLSLINDILDLSKIEAGHMELEPADFDLPGAIDNALILVRERASRRGITLGSTIDERLGLIRGDERKVKQVLLNLLSNALKFTPEGGPDRRRRPAARRGGGGVRDRYGRRHRARGSGGGVRGVPAGGRRGEESGRHRARAGPLPEVRRAPWRQDLGAERARARLDVHVHAAGRADAVVTRRAFIGTLAGGLLAAPLAAEAQPAGKVYRIGFLGTATPLLISAWLRAFRQGLRELRIRRGSERRD